VNFSKLINQTFLRRDAHAESRNNNKFLKTLTKWYKIYVVRFLVIKSNSGAEVSKTVRHWCWTVSWILRHQCRNVLGPKCPYTM